MGQIKRWASGSHVHLGKGGKKPGAEQHEHSRKGKQRALGEDICQARNPAWVVEKALPEEVMWKLGTRVWTEIRSENLEEGKGC